MNWYWIRAEGMSAWLDWLRSCETPRLEPKMLTIEEALEVVGVADAPVEEVDDDETDVDVVDPWAKEYA